jgi:hypothetical protein
MLRIASPGREFATYPPETRDTRGIHSAMDHVTIATAPSLDTYRGALQPLSRRFAIF